MKITECHQTSFSNVNLWQIFANVTPVFLRLHMCTKVMPSIAFYYVLRQYSGILVGLYNAHEKPSSQIQTRFISSFEIFNMDRQSIVSYKYVKHCLLYCTKLYLHSHLLHQPFRSMINITTEPSPDLDNFPFYNNTSFIPAKNQWPAIA